MCKMADELEKKIVKQIEYYFGDINLNRDKFLQEKIKEDDGWVTLEVLLTFKRLASFTTDAEVIAAAIEKSESKLVLVSEDRKKLRRNPEKPVPELDEKRKQDIMKRTAYAKGFPLDEDFNEILSFLETFGPFDSVNRRATKDHKFKGSCFITFINEELCKKFVELESLKYKDNELIRKFQAVYFDDKKKEIEERKRSKKEKADDKPQKPIEYPKGAVLHFTGLEEGQTITREEIKEKIKEIGDIDVPFVDFIKGDLQGYIRFPEENSAVEFHKKLTEGEMEVEKFKLKTRVLEGEEEEAYLKKTSDTVLEIRKKQKNNTKNNRKRKGNFGDYGRDSKNKRRN